MSHPVDAPERAPSPTLVAWRLEGAKSVVARLVPATFRDATPNHPEVAAWVARFLADPSSTPSLCLTGPTGTGKTHQTWGAFRAILEGRAHAGLGLDARITSHPDLNDSMRPKPDNSHAGALEPYTAAELLILDDLGTGKQTDWTGDSLYRLIDYRWSRNLPSIFTTNLTPNRLTEVVGDRVVSRLASAVRVAMKGDDRRWGARP